MGGDDATPNDVQVLSGLRDLEYPVAKQDVIREAEARGGSQNFLEHLQAIDEMSFSDHQAVEAALQSGPRL